MLSSRELRVHTWSFSIDLVVMRVDSQIVRSFSDSYWHVDSSLSSSNQWSDSSCQDVRSSWPWSKWQKTDSSFSQDTRHKDRNDLLFLWYLSMFTSSIVEFRSNLSLSMSEALRRSALLFKLIERHSSSPFRRLTHVIAHIRWCFCIARYTNIEIQIDFFPG